MPETTAPSPPSTTVAQPGAGQPPFGSSPATGPTQNAGYQAQGLQGLSLVVKGLERLIPLLGAGSDAGQDALEALKKLSKHIPPGTVSPAAQQNEMEKQRMAFLQKQGMMQQAMQRPPQQAGAQPMPMAA